MTSLSLKEGAVWYIQTNNCKCSSVLSPFKHPRKPDLIACKDLTRYMLIREQEAHNINEDWPNLPASTLPQIESTYRLQEFMVQYIVLTLYFSPKSNPKIPCTPLFSSPLINPSLSSVTKFFLCSLHLVLFSHL